MTLQDWNECLVTLLDDQSPAAEGGDVVAYESSAEPITLGYLFDFLVPEGYPEEMRADLTRSFELVLAEQSLVGQSCVGRD